MPAARETTTMSPRRFWIRGLVPWILLGIGLLHSGVGFSAGRTVLAEIAREGFWDTIHTDSTPISRPLLEWFLVSGFLLLILGHLALWAERHARRPLPAALGVELLIFGLVLGVVSGGALPAVLLAFSGVFILVVARTSRSSPALPAT